MTDFDKIYNKYFSMDCPPSEGIKKKLDGCYNAINDFGQEPNESNCRECWKIVLKTLAGKS